MQTQPLPPNSNPNPNPMQALHFIRLLSSLRRPSAAASPRRRFRLVRRAAYASMALAVGPRMTWSRALLRRLRRSRPLPRPARKPRRAPSGRAAELRQLVPGGKAMDLCTLLEEAGHYIQCLSLQVKIMRSIADSAAPAGRKNAF